MITHGCAIVFAKTIHAVGDHLTRCYAKAFGCDFSEARMKRNEQAQGVRRQPIETGPQVDIGELADNNQRQSAVPSDGFALLD